MILKISDYWGLRLKQGILNTLSEAHGTLEKEQHEEHKSQDTG